MMSLSKQIQIHVSILTYFKAEAPSAERVKNRLWWNIILTCDIKIVQVPIEVCSGRPMFHSSLEWYNKWNTEPVYPKGITSNYELLLIRDAS